MKVKLSDINIPDGRFREDFGDIEELAESIKEFGLIQLPVLDEDMNIIAGERRIRACKYLNLEEIEVRILDNIEDLAKREMELEENIQRKDFTWQEEVRAKQELHKLKQEKHGAKISGHETEGTWGIEDTAEELDQSLGSVSMDIKLANALEEYPELEKEKNKHQAMKKYKKLKEEEIYQQMLSVLEDKDISERYEIHNCDCLEWMQKQEDESIDLIIMDPPWGIGMDSQSELSKHTDIEYSDALDDILFMVDLALEESYRILKEDRHLYFFFGIRHYQLFYEILIENGFEVDEIPLIWTKGQPGSAAKGRTYPSSYETIFFAYKGKRDLKSGDWNHFPIPRPSNNDRVHSAQKPLALLERFILNSSEPGEKILDPFCGSGSTVAAAVLQDRYGIGIEKSEKVYAKAVDFIRDKTKDKQIEDTIEQVKKEGAIE